jgi:hypothetical protein
MQNGLYLLQFLKGLRTFYVILINAIVRSNILNKTPVPQTVLKHLSVHHFLTGHFYFHTTSSGGARPQNLGGGGIWWANSHLGGRCYLPMPLSHDFRPQEIRPPPLSQKGIYILGISPPWGEYPIGISRPLGYSPPIYAMWFIQIISWYFHLISALHVW